VRKPLLILLAAGAVAFAGWMSRATAAPPTSITFDGSLGAAGTLSPSSPGFYPISPSMGRTIGPNLFQSFGQFNVGTGDTALFEANAGTQNIIARVTGGAPSSIDGTIQSQAPNLFFLNPAGVMFGANAQVNVAGAFTVGTANYVKLSDGGIFYAQLGGAADNLTSAPVSAFGFLTATPQPVSFSGSLIETSTGGGFHVIGGDITVDGSFLFAPGGNLTLFSAASAGEVPFSLDAPGAGFAHATNTAFGNITVQNSATLAVSSTTGGGKVVIRGGRMVVQGSSIIGASNFGGTNPGGSVSLQAASLDVTTHSSVETSTTGAGAAGDVTVSAAGAVAIDSAGTITSFTTGSGAAGNVTVQAQTVAVDGSATPGAPTGISSPSEGSGPGGQVSVTTQGQLTIDGEGVIAANAFAAGDAGSVTVNAGSMLIDGSAAPGYVTGVGSNVEPNATGNGGLVTISVTHGLTLLAGGTVTADTFSSGRAGGINLSAGSLNVDGTNAPTGFTGIGSDSGVVATGAGGNVAVDVTGGILLNAGGFIEANTNSSADAGSVNVVANSIALVGSLAVEHATGIFSQSNSANPAATGNAGTVDVEAIGALVLEAGAGIQTNTVSAGNAGNITVHAGSLTINGGGAGTEFTGVSSDTGAFGVPSTGTGHGGSISITVGGALTLVDQGAIASDTFTSGDAGSLVISAGSLSIDGSAAPGLLTGISSQSVSADPASPGNAGSITLAIQGSAQLIGAAKIATDTATAGSAGDIHFTAGSLDIDGSLAPGFTTGITSETQPGSTGHGGSITVGLGGALTIEGGGVISATAFAAGGGGNVTVNAGSVTINDSATPSYFAGISSDSEPTATGPGGDVQVTATGAITVEDGGEISASTFSSGNAGTVVVRGGSLTISGFTDQPGFTGIASNASFFSSGNAGSITLDIAGQATLLNGGEIVSNADATGNAGVINLDAGSLTIDGTRGYGFAYIASATQADNAGNFASAGSVNINVDGSLVLLGSGGISTTTTTSGNAGDITIHAGSLLANGAATPGFLTGISSGSESDDPTATGSAGNVSVFVRGGLNLIAGGGIDVTTATAGRGGNIIVQAGSIGIDGTGAPSYQGTGFAAEAFASGNGGSIHVNSGSVMLDHRGEITTASAASNGGDISVTSDVLQILNSGRINTAAELDGGDINLNIGSLLYLFESGISTNSQHNGGNILIGTSPQFVVLDHSTITANAVNQGGNITIESRDFLNAFSDITASGAQNGVINITAPNLDLGGSLLPLPTVLVSDEDRLRENCARSIKHEFSSLIAVGRGGTETAPDELSPDFGAMTEALPSR
jgi:filamentous hemagglutinin family protein